MVRLRNDPKYTLPWDERELDAMDEAAWERYRRLSQDIQRRMRPLEAEFVQRWIAEEEGAATQAGTAIDAGAFKQGDITLLILTLLRDEPMHGHQISQFVYERSNGQYEIKAVALFPLLYHLEKSRIIEGIWQKNLQGQERKYFRLTNRGRSIVGERENTRSLEDLFAYFRERYQQA